MTTRPSPAESHRAAAANFTRLVERTTHWDAPAPVPGWTARDVVEHLVTWLPALLEESTDYVLGLPPQPESDLSSAWLLQVDAVQRLLEDPATESMSYSSDQMGEMPLRQMVDSFYTSDVFMHSWDLAQATGQEHGLDDAVAQAMLTAMEPADEMMRGDHFGPKQPVDAAAGGVEKLMAFIGRDLHWAPN